MLVALWICSAFCILQSTECADTYDEELVASHLPDGSILASLRFSMLKDTDLGDHYNMFPMALGEVLRRYDVTELHLSMSQGFWRHRFWGYTDPSVPTGAQLVAWFENRNASGVDQKWKGLIHALTGLFCASLSQINSQLTVRPQQTHRMRGVSSSVIGNDSRFVRYGVLPSENVCTENLTPWKKLLPCKSDVSTDSGYSKS
ncbi:unnamed protein product [Soboliphyme baturini]|uniref:Phospholipase B-like n=1 Tax=Soboliphyme baturini TaxID=241478 RepID=A0A183J3Q2_9BILA|nr:unnamed protein product [Soboliphyme baturini]